ncbi:hypothetical protein DFS33DRAFT_21768 [Desarmillaria ectypa]|nr:hypothetical protein DFS33DRAFT_21768 [Desarmillaria ectypa]
MRGTCWLNCLLCTMLSQILCAFSMLMIATISLALNIKTHGYRLSTAKSLIFNANDKSTRKTVHNGTFYLENAITQAGTQLFKVLIRDFE